MILTIGLAAESRTAIYSEKEILAADFPEGLNLPDPGLWRELFLLMISEKGAEQIDPVYQFTTTTSQSRVFHFHIQEQDHRYGQYLKEKLLIYKGMFFLWTRFVVPIKINQGKSVIKTSVFIQTTYNKMHFGFRETGVNFKIPLYSVITKKTDPKH